MDALEEAHQVLQQHIKKASPKRKRHGSSGDGYIARRSSSILQLMLSGMQQGCSRVIPSELRALGLVGITSAGNPEAALYSFRLSVPGRSRNAPDVVALELYQQTRLTRSSSVLTKRLPNRKAV